MKRKALIICLSVVTNTCLIASAQEYTLRAQTYKKEGKTTQAIEAYKQALTLSPDDAQVHYEVGVLYAELEAFNEAITHLRTATQLQPENINTHFQLCIVYTEFSLDFLYS